MKHRIYIICKDDMDLLGCGVTCCCCVTSEMVRSSKSLGGFLMSSTTGSFNTLTFKGLGSRPMSLGLTQFEVSYVSSFNKSSQFSIPETIWQIIVNVVKSNKTLRWKTILGGNDVRRSSLGCFRNLNRLN